MGEEKDRCIRGSGSRRWACRGARRCFGRRVSSWKELLWLELVTKFEDQERLSVYREWGMGRHGLGAEAVGEEWR